MSNYPQNPYGNPPQPPGMYPPGYGQPGVMQYPKTSAAAVTALVMGLLLCVPAVTGLGAIVFGIIGIVKTGSPMTRGRGMAIAGLLLGLLNLVGWGLGSWAGYSYFNTVTAPDRTLAKAFVQDLADGKISDAQALCDPTANTASLAAISAKLKAGGPIVQMNAMGFNVQSKTTNGTTASTTVIAVGIQQNNSQSRAQITVYDLPDGSRKIEQWNFTP